MDSLAVSIVDAAHRAGVGRTLIYREMGAGRLPFLKVGRRTLIRTADLAAWLDAHAVAAPASSQTAAPRLTARA